MNDHHKNDSASVNEVSDIEVGNDDRIAIIGMSGRFPGADSVEKLWENLKAGIDSITEFSNEELKGHVNPALLENPNFIKSGHVLENIDLFDAGFFGYTPRQASKIDPQQRLFLECAWEALEHAGYIPDNSNKSIGVYASGGISSYIFNLTSDLSMSEPFRYFDILMANDKDYLATRTSYKLNLKGPSMVIQTACSSSLVAACVASQSLLDYHCDIALVGGVSVNVPQRVGYLNEEGSEGVSRDSHCRAFDANASGLAYGNGIGVIVLKRLDEALRDGDTIYASILGFAMNNDGSDKVGFSAPSVDGQVRAISEALSMAEIDPESISYVEAHGTGTLMGDPIEIAALTKAYNVKKRNYCGIGSLKSNIGHLNTAAGVSSLIKTAMSLKHKTLVPSINYSTPNPEIDFENSPFYVTNHLKPWHVDDGPRIAGISSFGFGGSNAHMILEEPPQVTYPKLDRSCHLLVLSARSEHALDNATERLVEYLKSNSTADLSNLAYTLQIGRKAFDYRRTIIAQTREEAIVAMETQDPDRVLNSFVEGQSNHKSVTFMFPGAGSQYVNMGLELYQNEPKFKASVDYCAPRLVPKIGMDIRTVLYPELFPENTNSPEKCQQLLKEPLAGFSALFVINYASAKLWQSWSIEPAAMIGHSLGEYVAATLAGVFSIEDALAIVAKRAELIQQSVRDGAMITILAPENNIKDLLNDRLSIGAVNGPSLCTVSGTTEDIDALQTTLKDHKIRFQRLAAGCYVGHSCLLDSIVDEFGEYLAKFKLKPPRLPFISNTSGTWIKDKEATDPNYWVGQLRKTVRFSEGIGTLLYQSDTILLEVGPGRALSGLTRRNDSCNKNSKVLASLPDEVQDDDCLNFITRTLGSLWLSGLTIDWSKAIYRPENCHRIPLPTYPFERQSYWIDGNDKKTETKTDNHKTNGKRISAMDAIMDKQADLDKWFSVPSWRQSSLLHLANVKPALVTKDCWLLFADNYGVGSQMINRLRNVGQNVIRVDSGTGFEEMAPDHFRINPKLQADYDALIGRIVERRILPDRIVHFWSVTPDDDVQHGIEYYEETQNFGYRSLLYLVRSLSSAEQLTEKFSSTLKNNKQLQITIVSTNLYSVNGHEKLSPEKSTILGPVKVIPSEFGGMECVNIDIEMDQSTYHLSPAIIDSLIIDGIGTVAKSTSTTPPATAIAYRGNYRWEQFIGPIRLPTTEKGKIGLRKGGVYLITGGLGGVPYELARYLAKEWQAKLILTGRTELPDRAEWSRWLENHSQEDAISHRIRKILALEALGSKVIVVSANITDLAKMRQGLNLVKQELGTINGVFHAASMVTSSMILVQTPERAATVLGPKIQGTLVLAELFKDSDLDFMFLFSSIASYLCALGHSDYTAANIFMDTYAHVQSQMFFQSSFEKDEDPEKEIDNPADSRQSTPAKKRTSGACQYKVVSVNWGYWHGVGIGVELIPKLREFMGADVKIQGIMPEEGIECLTRILASDYPQVIASSSDFPILVQKFQESSKSSLLEYEKFKVKEVAHARPKLAVRFVAPRTDLEKTIADVWQDLLGIEGIGVHDSFLELGGDSLQAMPMVTRLKEILHFNVPIRTIFSQNTVAKLTRYLLEHEEKKGNCEKIARIIQQVKKLSPNQIQTALEQKSNTNGNDQTQEKPEALV